MELLTALISIHGEPLSVLQGKQETDVTVVLSIGLTNRAKGPD